MRCPGGQSVPVVSCSAATHVRKSILVSTRPDTWDQDLYVTLFVFISNGEMLLWILIQSNDSFSVLMLSTLISPTLAHPTHSPGSLSHVQPHAEVSPPSPNASLP